MRYSLKIFLWNQIFPTAAFPPGGCRAGIISREAIIFCMLSSRRSAFPLRIIDCNVPVDWEKVVLSNPCDTDFVFHGLAVCIFFLIPQTPDELVYACLQAYPFAPLPATSARPCFRGLSHILFMSWIIARASPFTVTTTGLPVSDISLIISDAWDLIWLMGLTAVLSFIFPSLRP